MKLSAQTCSNCMVGTLAPTSYEQEFRHGRKSVSVQGLECYVCSNCGADPIDYEQISRNQVRIADAKRRLDGLKSSSELRAARKQLRLNQKTAALVFGGGPNAFSKYERGELVQRRHVDNSLDLALRFPDCFEFLLRRAGLPSSLSTTPVPYFCSFRAVTSQSAAPAVLNTVQTEVSNEPYLDRRKQA